MNMKVVWGGIALLMLRPTAIFEHMRSAYGALSSYADTGTVIYEYSATVQDECKFSGKPQPKDTNDTLEGRARNRRVELTRFEATCNING